MDTDFKALRLALPLLLLLLVGGNGKAVEAGSANPQAFDLKVRADLLLKRGRLEPAISLYEKTIRRDPYFANAYYNLATAYYLQGRFLKAAENLEKFAALHPQDAETLYNLGCLKLKLGKIEEAKDCFSSAAGCPCNPQISQKIKEALQFMKDLQSQTPEAQDLIAYLLTTSLKSL